MNAQIIELEGRPAFAVVPMDEWKALLAKLEDLQDLADARSARLEECLPIDFIERRLAGESPLRLWREYRKMTLQALATQAGCSRQMVSMIEHRKTMPSAALLAQLARALGCDMDDLHD